jgi:C4-dicarboxylate-specific signal transduction histidine kinase
MPLLARLLLLIVIAVLPALGILLYNEHDLRGAREAEAHAEALRHAHAVADELQRVVDGARDLLLTIAHAPPVRDGHWRDCNSYLDELGNAYPSYSRLTVADLSGRSVCASEPVPQGHSMAARVYFQEALASGEFTVGTFAIGRRSGDAILPFAAPFRDRSGQIAGVIINGLRLDWLATQVGRKLLPPDGTLTIADRDGTILTRSPDPERWTGKKMDVGPLFEAGEARTTETAGLDGVRRIYAYAPPRASSAGLHVIVGIGPRAPLNRSR